MIPLLKRILRTGILTEPPAAADIGPQGEIKRLSDETLAILGRALTIREVDAGSCNGCELEIHALNNAYYNLEGRGMAIALQRTYDATPDPKLVVAVGDCGCGCGEVGALFNENYATCGPVDNVVAVDVRVPGCPPTPLALMQGILTAVKRR